MQSVAIEMQAHLYCRYILGVTPSAQIVERYCRGSALLFPDETENDALVDFTLRHPAAIGPLDAVHAWRSIDSPLRRRIILMFAILETEAALVDEFSAFKHSGWHTVRCAAALAVAVVNVAVGAIIERAQRARV
jgi:hypothetical protein